ncbi:autotransporter outer membrane beta-barrel domain-containing protein [Klebsiella michiganensis]|uniref:autotransporter outer membrane beta-barrel domain-containing protein n=1 Tax=Klebsiella michiganensis TaxID=1134687 RepID=UPI000A3611CB|nr:autotransporter outer membrane beta-barrel domain-containing protein [Klebsiella michiganensis]MCW9340453.1 autotransporter outer membrane beta-barrel domain-containing protein [Klebsiella michiganensis]OUG43657.1 lipase [Klebsiella michiganensis]
MIIKKCNGLRVFLAPACVSVWASCVAGANAWQQEYIAIDTKSNTAERYTWDSDHQPRYEDILAERINASDDPSGLAFNQAVSPVDSARGMSVGWNFSLTEGMTSGPVASLHSDLTSPPLTRNAAGTGYVNTLGWRVDYQKLWGVHPWAQVSYNQELTTDFGGANRMQDGAWRDVTFGADMSLNSHLAAWAALSQADNLPTGANYLYLMGVSANF